MNGGDRWQQARVGCLAYTVTRTLLHLGRPATAAEIARQLGEPDWRRIYNALHFCMRHTGRWHVRRVAPGRFALVTGD